MGIMLGRSPYNPELTCSVCLGIGMVLYVDTFSRQLCWCAYLRVCVCSTGTSSGWAWLLLVTKRRSSTACRWWGHRWTRSSRWRFDLQAWSCTWRQEGPADRRRRCVLSLILFFPLGHHFFPRESVSSGPLFLTLLSTISPHSPTKHPASLLGSHWESDVPQKSTTLLPPPSVVTTAKIQQGGIFTN